MTLPERHTYALTANAFYSSLLLPSGAINYNASPSPENKTLFHLLLEKMDAKSQTTFRSFDTKLGTNVLKKIHKKISTVASRQVQINQAQHQIRNSKWDPSTQTLRKFTAFISDLKSVLSNMPRKPTQAEYRSWWINLLPLPQFKEVKYQLLMETLPPHWSDVDEITDLAEATQTEIDTRLLNLASPKPKDKKPPPTDRGPPTPRLPNPRYPPPTGDIIMPTRADDSRKFLYHGTHHLPTLTSSPPLPTGIHQAQKRTYPFPLCHLKFLR